MKFHAKIIIKRIVVFSEKVNYTFYSFFLIVSEVQNGQSFSVLNTLQETLQISF